MITCAQPGGFLQTGHLTAPARRPAFGFFRRSAPNNRASVPAPLVSCFINLFSFVLIKHDTFRQGASPLLTSQTAFLFSPRREGASPSLSLSVLYCVFRNSLLSRTAHFQTPASETARQGTGKASILTLEFDIKFNRRWVLLKD